ncbi:MAG: hypothetical protein AB7V07_03665 [Candidatus Delongbacteria bacterium]
MKYSLMFLIFTASCLNAFSLMGERSDDRFIWVGGGVGTMDTADGGLLDINASINYSKNDRIFKLRGIHANEMVLFGPRPNDEVWELGLLYGIRSTQGKASVSFLAGISYTGGIYKGDPIENNYYEELTFETVGIPLEAQFDVNLLKYIGLSIMFYANINPDKIYGGVNLAILIGYLP